MATGMPVAVCFMLINIVGTFLLFGGASGVEQVILSIYSSLATFVLLPIPLFVLMGEVIFHSGIALIVVDILDKWLGRLPGRLSLLAVVAGTVFSTLTGTSVASTAMLGSILLPEMESRGYKKSMTVGPILGSGGLAIMIPPSSLAVLLGAISEISVGEILIAIIVPGILMAALYASYVVLRCVIQPSLAPSYAVTHTPVSEKLIRTVRYVLPLSLIVFLVIGLIVLGVATPSEAAASGTIGSFILAAVYKGLNWDVIKKSTLGTLKITGMIFLIIAGAATFSQILSFSGAARGLTELATRLPAPPIVIVIAMQVVVLIMGGFMSIIAIMMITLPMFVPVVVRLGFDPVWFAAMFLINIEMALTTPPLGMSLYVMKGVTPPHIGMGDIIKAAVPFLFCDAIAMALIMAFPPLALWLPSFMH
jgi:tripartite ATP-independent transporter DctM subunit